MDRRRRLIATIAGVALAVGIIAGPALAANRSVTIAGFAFAPATVTVSVGDRVTWRNDDDTTHTATSGSAWSTGNISPGTSKSITFTRAGTYDYICAIHPTMSGRVVVRAASAGAPPPTDTAPVGTTTETDWVAGTLAFLGLAMLVGTFIADRRFRRARSESQRAEG
jgi:plastocyanin